MTELQKEQLFEKAISYLTYNKNNPTGIVLMTSIQAVDLAEAELKMETIIKKGSITILAEEKLDILGKIEQWRETNNL